jgi:D-glycero-alpha-D-manno-heptose-7-phosphate kinase
VALIAGLQVLAGGISEPATLARSAHEIEADDIGLQTGVQDQIAAAHGGCNLIAIDPYPNATVRALDLAPPTWDALRERIVTVCLGPGHHSSAVHEAVIARLRSTDRDRLLAPLRSAATDAATALVAGDIDAYGEAMRANTEAQCDLLPALVSERACDVIEVAKRQGAPGWKVNGAGGEGGSVTLVGPEDPTRLVHALGSIAGLTVLPLRPARLGARIVERG